MLLSGADHMTIAPRILSELNTTQFDNGSSVTQSLFESSEPVKEDWFNGHYLDVEDQFRLAMTMENDGMGEAKLAQVRGLSVSLAMK